MWLRQYLGWGEEIHAVLLGYSIFNLEEMRYSGFVCVITGNDAIESFSSYRFLEVNFDGIVADMTPA